MGYVGKCLVAFLLVGSVWETNNELANEHLPDEPNEVEDEYSKCQPTKDKLYLHRSGSNQERRVKECQRPSGWKPTQEKLDKILEEHTYYLQDPTDPKGKRANLCGADLRELDFPEEVVLSGAILSSANLSGQNLSHSTFKRTGFCHATLDRARFVEGKMQGSVFWFASAQKADFRLAQLQHAGFAGAKLVSANFLEGQPIVRRPDKHRS